MVVQVGRRNRAVGATLMNQESSRSHSIFSVTVEMATGAAEEVWRRHACTPRHHASVMSPFPGGTG